MVAEVEEAWQKPWTIEIEIHVDILTVTDPSGERRDVPRFRYRITSTTEDGEPVSRELAGECVVHARRGDRVVWRHADGPFAVHFAPLSPVDRPFVNAGKGASSRPATVGDQVPFGRYKAFVAAEKNGRLWTDDPPFEIGPK